MLLALFSDFWTLPWPTGSAPPVIVTQGPGSGGGKDKYFPQEQQYPDRADFEYWEAREAFLRRHLPEPEREPEEIPAEIEPVIARKRIILDDVLQARVTRNQIIDLDREMRELQAMQEQMWEDEAIELLLLA